MCFLYKTLQPIAILQFAEHGIYFPELNTEHNNSPFIMQYNDYMEVNLPLSRTLRPENRSNQKYSFLVVMQCLDAS